METAARAAEATGRTQMKQHRDDGLSAFHSGSRSIGSLGRKAPLETEKLEQVLVEQVDQLFRGLL
jgi:hypothetical protein